MIIPIIIVTKEINVIIPMFQKMIINYINLMKVAVINSKTYNIIVLLLYFIENNDIEK